MDEKLNINSEGMVEIGPGRYVNPNYISEKGIASAKYNTTPGANTIDRNTLRNDYGRLDIAPISVSTLTSSQKPYEIPKTEPVVSQTPALLASAEADVKQSQDATAQAEKNIADLRSNFDTLDKQKTGILDYLGLGESSAKTAYQDALKAYEDQLTPANKELSDIRTKEADISVKYRAEQDAINARGDITEEAKQGLLFNIDDKYGRVLADLAIRKSASLQNVTDLRQSIQDKLNLTLAPIDREQKFYKDFLIANIDDLKDDEVTKINQIISERDKIKKEITDTQTGIADVLQGYIDAGVKLPDDVVSQMLNAGSKAEAQSIALRAGYTEKTGTAVAGAVGGVATDNDFVNKLLSTAGGKAVTDTTIQKLDKGLTTLGQLGVLQANIEGAKTGPIVGAFRSANPWDTQAQTIKNQLNAIIPNLARGVYGEVGVLTDNDIRTYSQTIPSLKSTEEVRNAVLYITLDMIGKSIKNTLNTNASAGRDVSGFVDIYTEMENAKNSVLATIPGAQVPQAFNGTNQTQGIDIDTAYNEYLKATGAVPTNEIKQPRTSLIPENASLNLPDYSGFNFGSFLK